MIYFDLRNAAKPANQYNQTTSDNLQEPMMYRDEGMVNPTLLVFFMIVKF